MRLYNEAILVAVGLRLESTCVNLIYVLAAQWWTPSARTVCPARLQTYRRQINPSKQLSDLIWRAQTRTDCPSVKEPAGISSSDGRCPRRSRPNPLARRQVPNMGRHGGEHACRHTLPLQARQLAVSPKEQL